MIYSAKIYWPALLGYPAGDDLGKPSVQELDAEDIDNLLTGHDGDKLLTCYAETVEDLFGVGEVDVLFATEHVAIWGVANAADGNYQPNPEAQKVAAALGWNVCLLVGQILIVTATPEETPPPAVAYPAQPAKPWPPTRTFFAVTINQRYLKRVGRGMFLIELSPMGQHTLSEGWQLAKESGLSAKIKLAELFHSTVLYLKHPTLVPGAPAALNFLFDTVDKLMVWHAFPSEVLAALRFYADTPGTGHMVSGESMFYVNQHGTVTLEVDTRRDFIDVQGNLNIAASVFDTSNPPVAEVAQSLTCDRTRGIASKPGTLAYVDETQQWRLKLRLLADSKQIVIEQLQGIIDQINEGTEEYELGMQDYDIKWTLASEPLEE